MLSLQPASSGTLGGRQGTATSADVPSAGAAAGAGALASQPDGKRARIGQFSSSSSRRRPEQDEDDEEEEQDDEDGADASLHMGMGTGMGGRHPTLSLAPDATSSASASSSRWTSRRAGRAGTSASAGIRAAARARDDTSAAAGATGKAGGAVQPSHAAAGSIDGSLQASSSAAAGFSQLSANGNQAGVMGAAGADGIGPAAGGTGYASAAAAVEAGAVGPSGFRCDNDVIAFLYMVPEAERDVCWEVAVAMTRDGYIYRTDPGSTAPANRYHAKAVKPGESHTDGSLSKVKPETHVSSVVAPFRIFKAAFFIPQGEHEDEPGDDDDADDDDDVDDEGRADAKTQQQRYAQRGKFRRFGSATSPVPPAFIHIIKGYFLRADPTLQWDLKADKPSC